MTAQKPKEDCRIKGGSKIYFKNHPPLRPENNNPTWLNQGHKSEHATK